MLEYHLDTMKQLYDKTWDYAWKNVVPLLSKAVIEKGTKDQDTRSLLGLVNRTNDYKYETTDEFRAWHALFWDMSAEAKTQVYDINRNGYYFYEIISMMLESSDYFKDDLWKFILLGKLYISGRFDSSLKK